MASALRIGLLVAAALCVAGLAGELVLRATGFRFELTPERVQFGWPDVRNYLYLYDQGNWTLKDAAVYDVAAADGGFFYDVNYGGVGGNSHPGYQWNPQTHSWTFLGYNLS